ncbi:MAG: antitoxin, RHH family protein [Nitrospinae bacterium]|nr:antitoxin, RHH family protein [Nitrospinota bacterium]
MPPVNPRINVVFEKPVYKDIESLAKRDGVSMSLKVRDLVKEAMEIEEDRVLTSIAQTREKTFKRAKAIKHNDIW